MEIYFTEVRVVSSRGGEHEIQGRGHLKRPLYVDFKMWKERRKSHIRIEDLVKIVISSDNIVVDINENPQVGSQCVKQPSKEAKEIHNQKVYDLPC